MKKIKLFAVLSLVSMLLMSCTNKMQSNNAQTNNDLPTQVQLSESSFSCFAGDSGTITASVLPVTANQTITWSSSNDSIIEVYNGTWYANALGTATLVATSVNGVQGICRVSVNETFIDRLDKGGTSTNTSKYIICTSKLDDYSFEFKKNGSSASIDFKFVKVTVTNITITEYGKSLDFPSENASVRMFVNIMDKNSNIVIKEAMAFAPSEYAYVNRSYSGTGRKIDFDFKSSLAPYSMVLTNRIS